MKNSRQSAAMLRAAMVCVLLVTLACSREPLTIDGDSDAKARASIERIVQSLPIEQRGQFELAVKDVAMKDAASSDMDAFVMGGPFTRDMLARLHGKTADQIFAESGVPRTRPQ